MTIDELEEQRRADRKAQIAAHYAKMDSIAPVVGLGPNASEQDVEEARGMAALRQAAKNIRDYAFDAKGRSEVRAFYKACMQMGKNPVEKFGKLASIFATKKIVTKRVIVPNGPDKIEEKELPDWLQLRPPADAGTIPPLPVDPVTNERIANPWIGKLDADKARSREVIKTWSPRLARWLEDCSTHGGPTAIMLDELQFEKIEADHLRKLSYGEKEWSDNKLRKDIEPNVTNRMLFEKSIADPWLVKFHRQESEAGSPRLKDDLTTRMALAKHDPELRELHKAAHEILKAEAEQQEQAA